MTISRFFNKDGQQQSIAPFIFRAVRDNSISYKKRITVAGDRLDHIAYEVYQDAQLWWIIAAASGIGWWLQVPAGIVLFIPASSEEISQLKDRV